MWDTTLRNSNVFELAATFRIEIIESAAQIPVLRTLSSTMTYYPLAPFAAGSEFESGIIPERTLPNTTKRWGY